MRYSQYVLIKNATQKTPSAVRTARALGSKTSITTALAPHHPNSKATDHHARSSSKRVVGVLLSQDNGKSIANSFGVPFEEEDKDAKTWFLDHSYVEGMFENRDVQEGQRTVRDATARGHMVVTCACGPFEQSLRCSRAGLGDVGGVLTWSCAESEG